MVYGRTSPLLRENLAETNTDFQNADFQSIFPHSASDVSLTQSEKSPINMNRKSAPATGGCYYAPGICPHYYGAWRLVAEALRAFQ